MRLAITLFLALIGVGFAAPAAASSDVSGNFGIQAYVPAVCDIASDDFTVEQDGVVSGSVQEFCNTNTGFQIVASHRPLMSGESADVRYGGVSTALDASGLASLAFRSGQRFATVPVSINASELEAPLSVAFSLYAV